MQIVAVIVKDASGMTISDRGTYTARDSRVQVSPGLARAMQLLAHARVAPTVYASVDGRLMRLMHLDGDMFLVAGAESADAREHRGFWRDCVRLVRSPGREQRRQFGRCLHTLAAASVVGAVLYCYANPHGSAVDFVNEASLLLAALVSLFSGLVAMNGE
jgi:hypothetical protein